MRHLPPPIRTCAPERLCSTRHRPLRKLAVPHSRPQGCRDASPGLRPATVDGTAPIRPRIARADCAAPWLLPPTHQAIQRWPQARQVVADVHCVCDQLPRMCSYGVLAKSERFKQLGSRSIERRKRLDELTPVKHEIMSRARAQILLRRELAHCALRQRCIKLVHSTSCFRFAHLGLFLHGACPHLSAIDGGPHKLSHSPIALTYSILARHDSRPRASTSYSLLQRRPRPSICGASRYPSAALHGTAAKFATAINNAPIRTSRPCSS